MSPRFWAVGTKDSWIDSSVRPSEAPSSPFVPASLGDDEQAASSIAVAAGRAKAIARARVILIVCSSQRCGSCELIAGGAGEGLVNGRDLPGRGRGRECGVHHVFGGVGKDDGNDLAVVQPLAVKK